MDLQLGDRDLKSSVLGFKMHVPAVEADPAVSDLLAETRVRGLSDKSWNVLSQNVNVGSRIRPRVHAKNVAELTQARRS